MYEVLFASQQLKNFDGVKFWGYGWPINLIIICNIHVWTTISVIPVDSMIWLCEKLESRMQKSECTSVLHYSMFCTFCSVFCPALNLFLFPVVYLYVILGEEYFFHKIVCGIFSHDTYMTKILHWKLCSAEYNFHVHIPPTCTSWPRDDSSDCSVASSF